MDFDNFFSLKFFGTKRAKLLAKYCNKPKKTTTYMHIYYDLIVKSLE